MSLSSPMQANPYAATRSQYGGGRGSVSGPSGSAGGRASRLLKRMLKFPQMDFEVAVWEMSSLIIAPKKVFRNVYYRKRTNPSSNYPHAETTFPACSSTPLLLMILPTETRNTYTSADPAFPYLLCFFLFLTSFAWSLAYANAAAGNIIRIAFLFVFVHCLLSSLLVATFMYFFTGKALGPGGFLVGRGGGRRRGLFGGAGEGLEELEFGYCFDVSIRAFFPLWVFLYMLQFVLLPIVTANHWPSTLLSNIVHLVAFSYATYITFLGYNSLPFLSSSQVLLAPLFLYFGLFIITTVTGWNASLHFAPILWCGGGLRKTMT